MGSLRYRQLPKLNTRVRFPSPAYNTNAYYQLLVLVFCLLL